MPRVMPTIVPRAYGSHHGEPRPVNAGTTYTPPLSGTLAASGPISAASSMMPRPSRSHWIAAPVTKIAPSSAYATVPSASAQATVVSMPSVGGGHAVADVEQHEAAGAVGVLRHARLEARLPEQRRLLVAGDAGDRDAGRRPPHRSDVTPKRPLDGRTSGSASNRHVEQLAQLVAPSAARRCRTASCGWRSSDRWRAPRRRSGSTAATSRSCRGRGRRRPRSAPSRQQPLELGAGEVRIEHQPGACADQVEVPVRRRARRSAPRCGGPARRSRCRTARPVVRFQATTVSRWLVMPIAATCSAPTASTTSSSVVVTARPRSRRRRARPSPGCGIVLRELAVRRDRRPLVGEHGAAAHAGGARVDGDHTRPAGHGGHRIRWSRTRSPAAGAGSVRSTAAGGATRRCRPLTRAPVAAAARTAVDAAVGTVATFARSVRSCFSVLRW